MNLECPNCGSIHHHLIAQNNQYCQLQCDICEIKWIPNFDKEEYSQSIKWNHTSCHFHPDQPAMTQINPPFGKFLCAHCFKTLNK